MNTIPVTLKAAKTDIAKLQVDLSARDKQLEAADTHIRELTKALTQVNDQKRLADLAIVDMHTHIQQLKTLLVRYIS